MTRFYPISPRKGFQCAYGVLYQHHSCSEAVYKLVQTKPFSQLPRLIFSQFSACSNAYQVIQASQEDDPNAGRCILLPSQTEEDDQDTNPSKDQEGECKYGLRKDGCIMCCAIFNFIPFEGA